MRLTLLLLLSSTALFADVGGEETLSNSRALLVAAQSKSTKNGNGKEKKTPEGYNPSARPYVDDVDVFVFGEPLLMKPIQGGMEFAFLPNGGPGAYLGAVGPTGGTFGLPNNITAPVAPINGTIRTANGKWDWGFRVGAGYNTLHGGWDVTSSWLRYHTVDSKSNRPNKKGAPLAPLFTPPYEFPIPPNLVITTSRTSARWKLKVDLIDAELGREFKVNEWTTLRPFLGPRVAFIPQSFRQTYFDGTFAGNLMGEISPNTGLLMSIPDSFVRAHIRSNFWGVGPRGGLNSMWKLGAGFSLFGNADLSILWGSFHVKSRFEVNGGSMSPSLATVSNVRNRHQTVRPTSTLDVGVRYDYVFDKSYALGVLFGYEHMFFWHQNQFMRFNIPFTMALNAVNDNLALNGFHLGVAFDF